MDTRRQFLTAVALGGLAGAAGCSSGPDGAEETGTDDGETATDDGKTRTGDGETPGGTDSATETSATDVSGGVSSASAAVRAVVSGMDVGSLDVIANASVGFAGMDEKWSPDAGVVLPGQGDTLVTQLIQGEATAREAYGNFEPDGQYFDAQALDVETAGPVAELRDRINEMDGPDVDRAVKTEPVLDYRVNLDGTWYDAERTTADYAVELDGSWFVSTGRGSSRRVVVRLDGPWFVSTGVPPWHLVADLVPDEAGFSNARLATIRRTVSLPLGDGG